MRQGGRNGRERMHEVGEGRREHVDHEGGNGDLNEACHFVGSFRDDA